MNQLFNLKNITMRKILLTTILSIFCFTVFAQVSPINIGIHGGFINTKIDTKSLSSSVDVLKSSAKGGYMIGAFARINLGKLYFEPALNYSERKTDVSLLDDSGANLTREIKYASVDIPLLLGYKIVKLPLLKVRAFAGPVASFSVDPLDIDWDGVDGADPDIDPKKASWNIKIGAGIDVWKLSLDLDYEKSLTDFKGGDIKAPDMFNVTIGLRIL